MEQKVDTRFWRLCAWNGPLFMGVFIIFWGIMGHNLPPYSADLPASDIAAYFRENANQVRTGMVLAMTFTISYCVWGLAIAKVMEQVVGKDNILVDLEKWGAGLTVVPVLVSCSFWLTGAFRPEALPDSVLQMLYDMAWLLIDLAYSITSVQMFALGAAFLMDRRQQPLVPKWLAWYGIWVGFMFIAECLMPFFKSGPFSRSGTLNYWIEFSIWFVWCPTLTYYLLRSITRIEQEQAHA
ncbi:hypothetical protein [Aquisediminimonas sediminicola]|uniref:hypothetical protein n=1 Tax=Alteraquisediminimonas sediminicola TaxID=2676787 RepID=UPI001C8EA044|nr:hypothetical protein [Aquisediminimonas sediminicola]